MANIVFYSNDKGCISAGKWFVKHQNCIDRPSNLDALGDGDTLFVVAHDSEMDNGEAFLEMICGQGFPMTAAFSIVLIVCSAQSYLFEKDLLTPAERIANHFQRSVFASENVVTGIWNDNGNATFNGKYVEVKPNSDITSLMGNLSIDN